MGQNLVNYIGLFSHISIKTRTFEKVAGGSSERKSQMICLLGNVVTLYLVISTQNYIFVLQN